MSGHKAPPWLVELQERFGAVICSPLDRSTGTLTAVTEGYDPAALAETLDGPTGTAAERLAIYNRQYWFRLFSVMHGEFSLTARLLGYWRFNGLAGRFLQRRRPRGFDVGECADGFEGWLREQPEIQQDPSREALLEAAALDERWRAVFHAPEVPPFRPSAADAARLPLGQLRPSGRWALHRERWPLVELRSSLLASPGGDERPLALPAPLPSPQGWLLMQLPGQTARAPLEPAHASLLELLCSCPVGEALARLERECSPEERASLPGKVQQWLARSVGMGLWSGISFPP